MPCWWIPASCAKAFRPTTALFGCGQMPVMEERRWLAVAISSVFTPVERPSDSPLTRSVMTNSSSEVLPARSPTPLIVTSTCRAPFFTAASEFAMARPRSSWQWAERVTPGTSRVSFAKISPYSSGRA